MIRASRTFQRIGPSKVAVMRRNSGVLNVNKEGAGEPGRTIKDLGEPNVNEELSKSRPRNLLPKPKNKDQVSCLHLAPRFAQCFALLLSPRSNTWGEARIVLEPIRGESSEFF